jgi:hypothetical protein
MTQYVMQVLCGQTAEFLEVKVMWARTVTIVFDLLKPRGSLRTSGYDIGKAMYV